MIFGEIGAHLSTTFGIVDPTIAPSETFVDVWEHFGMTEAGLLRVILEQQ